VQAIRIRATGGPEVLQLEDVEAPSPGPGEVLVDVAAAGVNFIDTYQRSGVYPLELPTGLGLEGAGTVAAVGEGVHDRSIGDRVAWCDALGSYATQQVLPAERAVRVPDGVELESAASVMLQGMTAHYLSHSTYRLGRDDTALVYAPAGGVGRLLIQLAVRRGARVLAATSTEDKAAIARELGADAVINYREQDIASTVRELTDGQGVDVVYDSVGKATFDASLASLKPRGMLVLYGGASGQVPPFDPQQLSKGGSLFLTRPTLAHYTATSDELHWRASAVLDLVGSGTLELSIHDRYPLAEAPRSHSDLESGTTTGKLLLVP
jgi:NADPH2:quinone reductase